MAKKENRYSLEISLIFISWCFFFCFSHSLVDNSSASFSTKSCLPDQASALLQLKQEFALQKPNFSSLYWDPEEYLRTYPKMKFWKAEKDCCSWDGVTCGVITGHVVSLDLSCSWLHGPLHSNSSLFNLHQLQRLNLAINNFALSPIPSAFGQLSRLTHLNLSSSFFSGNIPLEISWLTKLVSLDLSATFADNYLGMDGPLHLQNRDLITRIVKNVTNIKELLLDKVGFFSQLPDSLANISSLETLSLSSCSLHGVFPTNIFQLPKLQYLDVAFNLILTGFLPEFHYGSNLTSLSLFMTTFSGALPRSIGNLKSLNVLDLGLCNFSGSLPSKLWNISELTYLKLEGNNFNGNHSLPSTIGKLTKLTSLVLDSAQFVGEVPFSIGNLTQLERLTLSGNNISGPIPCSLGKLTQLEVLILSRNNLSSRIPDSLGNLTHLEVLDLSWNNFSSRIPHSLGNLSHLNVLNLGINSLNGVIPWSLFTIPSLKWLNMDHNQLQGPMNVPLFPSSQLTRLSIKGNKLDGQIPKSISSLTNLEVLRLDSNFFSGIVEWGIFSDMKQLNSLDLSYNNISKVTNAHHMTSSLPKFQSFHLASCNINEFPEFFKSLDELQVLDLSRNRIEGSIPSWFLDVATESLSVLNLSYNSISGWEQAPLILPWKKLEYLGLHSNKLHGSLIVPSLSTAYYIISENNLSGSIHPFFCNLSNLQVLDVSNNNLTGIIPTCFGKYGTSLWELRTLDLSNNQLQGKVPRSLIRCTELEILNLGQNQITGTFPFWLSKLPELQVLVLRSNQFYGHVWSSSTEPLDFKKLRIIDLSFNKFSGNLPSQYFASWSAMIEAPSQDNSGQLRYMGDIVYYYSDSVTVMNKGLVMELEKITTIFTSIDFSNNRFAGEIPRSTGNLLSLHVLNLSSNSFTGPIPSAFGNLKELESLDLSKNNLSGLIPLDFVKLTFLSYLNLSQNRLTGHIPEGGQIGTFPSSAFEGNLGLCGPSLARKCDDEHAEPPASPNNNQEADEFDFGWRVVVIGYGCGLVVGLAAGHVIISKWPNWFSKTFRVNLLRR